MYHHESAAVIAQDAGVTPQFLPAGQACGEGTTFVADVDLADSSGDTNGASRGRFRKQASDPRGRRLGRGALGGFLPHHKMPEGRERSLKAKVDSASTAVRRLHEARKVVPIPGKTVVEDIERNRLQIDQVPGRSLASLEACRRNPN